MSCQCSSQPANHTCLLPHMFVPVRPAAPSSPPRRRSGSRDDCAIVVVRTPSSSTYEAGTPYRGDAGAGTDADADTDADTASTRTRRRPASASGSPRVRHLQSSRHHAHRRVARRPRSAQASTGGRASGGRASATSPSLRPPARPPPVARRAAEWAQRRHHVSEHQPGDADAAQQQQLRQQGQDGEGWVAGQGRRGMNAGEEEEEGVGEQYGWEADGRGGHKLLPRDGGGSEELRRIHDGLSRYLDQVYRISSPRGRTPPTPVRLSSEKPSKPRRRRSSPRRRLWRRK